MLSEQIRELGESFLESVLEVCAGLSPDEVAIVMDDFEHGRAHLIEVLTNKLQQWTVLPWRLVALGDWDMSRLRDTARKILAEFARCPDEAKHHRITLEWLRPGSLLRADIQALADGETIANLPRLRYRVGEYFFLPTAERRQEGDHSLLHRGSSSRASGPYNSLVLRMPELEKRCKTKAAWRKCSRLYKSLADVKSLAARLGVQRHPLFVRAQRQAETFEVLQCVLYSLDAEAQFAQLEGAKNKRKKKAEELKQAAFGKKARTALSTIAVEDAARVQHIQSMLQPGNLYSVPAAAVQLGRLGQERAPQPAGDGGEALGLDVGSSHIESGQNHSVADADIDADLALGPANENIFFRVISPRPHQGKHVPLPAAAGKRLGQPDISYTVHHAVKHGDAVSVCVEPIRHEAQTASISVTSLLA